MAIFFKKYAVFIFVFVGFLSLSLYAVAKYGQLPFVGDIQEGAKNILLSIATSTLSGGVFATVLKSLQFKSVFKEDLEDIIYSKKFLMEGKNLKDRWMNVSKASCNYRFLSLGEDYLEDIYDKYLPAEKKYYYKNLKNSYELEKLSDNIIKVNVKTYVTIRALDEKEYIELRPSSTLRKDDESHHKYYLVQGNKGDMHRKEIDVEYEESDDPENKQNKKVTYIIKLTGDKEYTIYRTWSFILDLNIDRHHLYRTFNFLSDMEVTVKYPKDLNLQIRSCGLLHDFDVLPDEEDGYVSRKYNGVVFPQQGYMLLLL